jgi:hypothetical protein
MAQQTDENGKPLTYWGGVDFTNKNANNIKSDSTQLSGTILASESLGVDNLVNKQQTAVEWLVKQLKERGYAGEFPPHLLFEMAKAMEKEQIEDAHIEGQRVFDKHPHTQWTNDQAEQYYNETYGK